MNAETLTLIAGICAFLLTLSWVRNRDLREKYAVGWIILACVLLVFGLFPELIMAFARAHRLSFAVAVLFPALGLIYAFCFTVSVSLTRAYRREVILTQEIALLEERLRRLEAASPAGASPARTTGRPPVEGGPASPGAPHLPS